MTLTLRSTIASVRYTMPKGVSARATSASACADVFSARDLGRDVLPHAQRFERRPSVLARGHAGRGPPSPAARRRAAPPAGIAADGKRRLAVRGRDQHDLVGQQVDPRFDPDQSPHRQIVHPVGIGRDEQVRRRALLDLPRHMRSWPRSDTTALPRPCFSYSRVNSSSASLRLAAAKIDDVAACLRRGGRGLQRKRRTKGRAGKRGAPSCCGLPLYFKKHSDNQDYTGTVKLGGLAGIVAAGRLAQSPRESPQVGRDRQRMPCLP